MALPGPHPLGAVGRKGAGVTLLALPRGAGGDRESRAFGAALWGCSLHLQACRSHMKKGEALSPLAEGSSRAPGPEETLKAIPAQTSPENRGVCRWGMRWQRVHARCCSRKGLGEMNSLLAAPSFLFCLRLSSNSVGDNGSIALAEALRVNHSLQSLE